MNLKDTLRARQVPYQESVDNANEIRVCCPFCPDKGESADSKFRLGINIATQLGHCFNCGWSSKHAVEALIRKLNLGVTYAPKVIEEEKTKSKVKIPDYSIMLHEEWQSSVWATKAKEYLESRGIGLDIMERKDVLFTEIGKYSHRVIFPVIAKIPGEKEELTGLVSRAILKTQTPRYLNSPGTKAIWNIPGGPRRKVILTEGIFKALALEKIVNNGIYSVGALCGHSVSAFQVQQLKGVEEVMLFPDPDAVGLKGVIKVAYKLKNQFRVYLPKIIPKKQADDMIGHELWKVLDSFELFDDSLSCRYRFETLKRNQEDQ